MLSLFLLTLYKSDFIYNSECCHKQKVTDTTAVVGCIRSGQDEEYRKLIAGFVEWCESRQFHLNSSKTKELMVDFKCFTSGKMQRKASFVVGMELDRLTIVAA